MVPPPIGIPAADANADAAVVAVGGDDDRNPVALTLPAVFGVDVANGIAGDVPVGLEAAGAVLVGATCKRLRNVTSSVLRLLRRCCR